MLTMNDEGRRKCILNQTDGQESMHNDADLRNKESHLAATSKPSVATPRDQQVYFPMTADHTLLHVIASNVARGILINVDIITRFRHNFISSFTCEGIVAPLLEGPELNENLSIPRALEPTSLQLILQHRRWIDLFPFPQLRDNILTSISQGELNESDFYEDIVGQVFEDCEYSDQEPLPAESLDKDLAEKVQIPGSRKLGEIGLVAWSDPWDISGWEVTEAFIQKWRFLFHGCQDLLKATNYWRELRGEDRLNIEV
jgi:hypothetical protein